MQQPQRFCHVLISDKNYLLLLGLLFISQTFTVSTNIFMFFSTGNWSRIRGNISISLSWLISVKMRCLIAVAVVLSLLSEHICAQAPGDAQSFCTETLPSVGVNILDYPPEVKPLMDSRHYRQLLPPNTGAVWQTVDNDNNNPSNIRTTVS